MAYGLGQASDVFGQAKQNAQTFGDRGTTAWSGMIGQDLANAQKPQGLTPQQMATATTAAKQSQGGSTAAITGQADLAAGRTGNPGSMVNAIGSANRGAAQNLGNQTLKLQEYSTNLAQQKQQEALKSLGSLYGQNVSGLNEMIGNENKAVSEITDADKAKHAATMGEIGMGLQAAGTIAGA